jgi:hypothetical protein
MQVVHVKLDTGLQWKSSIQQEDDSFYKQIGLKSYLCNNVHVRI